MAFSDSPLHLTGQQWAALVFHHDWSQTSEYLLFISDVAVAGGLLVLAQAGTPGLSLDARRQRRASRF